MSKLFLECKTCGANLLLKSHKLGCPEDPNREFRIKNKSNWYDTNLELEMLRPSSGSCNFVCPKCGCAYKISGEPFKNQKEADDCCGYMDTKEFEEEVIRRTLAQEKYGRDYRKNRKGGKGVSRKKFRKSHEDF